MKRRHILVASAAAAILPAAAVDVAPASQRLGLVSYSYWKRWRGKYANLRYPPFQNALDLLDHAQRLGIGSLQVGVGGWTGEFADKMRTTCEGYGIALEGAIDLPRAPGDSERFERELRTAKTAGATVFRTALGGRRYEVFTSHAAFSEWRTAALASLQLAEPIARRLDVRIGVENHKDLECDELVIALRELASPHIGACIDTGNSLALLEDPVEVVAALAPFAVTVHLKDMALHEYVDGFQLAEVPLGRGCLPLAEMIGEIRAANPAVRFHLEMITRDALDIPCLKENYWATFPNKPGADLARTLAKVRALGQAKLSRVSGLATEAALALEEDNIVQSFRYAGEKLGFTQTAAKPGQDP
jgi:sugar phosphate isomerase/epimerase